MIETIHLFPILDRNLIKLLRSLTDEEWNKQTIAKLWTVKDVAAHLLDTNIRALASRDRYFIKPDRQTDSYNQLVNYLNQLNADWVTAMKRVSPQMLTDLLEFTGKQYCDYLTTIDPYADSRISVAWAGEKVSKNWFHIAREYTEKWHHQQQIRNAVSKEGIMTRELFYPVIDTFMQGLAYAYRGTTAEKGTSVEIKIETEVGGSWFLLRKEGAWQLSKERPENIQALVSIHPQTAWKLFTKGISADTAMNEVVTEGNKELAQVALTLVAVMA